MKPTVQRPLRENLFILFVAIVTIVFFTLIKGFLMSAFWAIVLALVFRNTYSSISNHYKGKKDNRAALLTTLIILFLVIVPLVFIMVLLIDQSLELYQNIKVGQLTPSAVVDQLLAKIPRAETYLSDLGYDKQEIIKRLQEFGLSATRFLASHALSSTQSVANFIAQFFMMLYLLFFFLKDGDSIIASIMNAIPMGNRREKILIDRFTRVTRATLRGTVIVAVVQGTIGGVLFWGVGIDAAVFWGGVMTLLALLPIGGSGIIWVPAALIALAEGDYVKAGIILVVGSLIIGLVDNILRPLLVGRDTKMPDYLVLIATLGGIAAFGLSGFIIGPVIAALFITSWEIMGEAYGGKEK